MESAIKFGIKMTAETVFIHITAPLQTLLKKEADQLHGDSLSVVSIHWIRGIQNLLLKPLTPDVAAIINASQ